MNDPAGRQGHRIGGIPESQMCPLCYWTLDDADKKLRKYDNLMYQIIIVYCTVMCNVKMAAPKTQGLYD